jgi:hypothetical protein
MISHLNESFSSESLTNSAETLSMNGVDFKEILSHEGGLFYAENVCIVCVLEVGLGLKGCWIEFTHVVKFSRVFWEVPRWQQLSCEVLPVDMKSLRTKLLFHY